MRNKELDRILAALAREVTSRESDLLLNLRDASRIAGAAGSCVSIYYSLLEVLDSRPSAAVPIEQLRLWLERHLNLEVLDDERHQALESLPLHLSGAVDLESFCHRAMDRLRKDRCFSASRLRLQIEFSQSQANCA
jgi:hypothetical protein